jgi:hypothetical protein
MDLVVTLDQLRDARVFVSEGEICIAGQRQIIEWLERKGYDTLDAILFLEYLEEMQGEYVDPPGPVGASSLVFSSP